MKTREPHTDLAPEVSHVVFHETSISYPMVSRLRHNRRVLVVSHHSHYMRVLVTGHHSHCSHYMRALATGHHSHRSHQMGVRVINHHSQHKRIEEGNHPSLQFKILEVSN